MESRNMITTEPMDGEELIKVVPYDSERDDVFAFLLELFWPFIDSYWAAVVTLFTLQPNRSLIERVLIERMQWFLEKSYLEGEMAYFESVSRDSLRAAIRVFRNWGVLIVNDSSSIELEMDFQDEEPLQELVDRISHYRHAPTSSHRDSAKRSSFPLLAKL